MIYFGGMVLSRVSSRASVRLVSGPHMIQPFVSVFVRLCSYLILAIH